jgi:hypothetical protein
MGDAKIKQPKRKKAFSEKKKSIDQPFSTLFIADH